MKLDLTKLPVLEGIVGFLLLAIVVTFVGAFAATKSSNGQGASPTAAFSATPTSGGTPSGNERALALEDNKFDTTEFGVTAGSTITFNITNNGKAIHNMHIAPTGDAFTEDLCKGSADPCSDPATIRGGKTATLKWDAPAAAGTYDFRCDFHPNEMKGKITVQ